MRRRLTLLAGLLGLVAAAAPAPADAASRAARLVPFDSCAQLTRYAQRNVVRARGREGVPFGGDVILPSVLPPPAVVDGQREAMPVGAPPSQQQAATGGGTDEQFSTTNVQEVGIDEADIVKTDGRNLFVVRDDALHVFDVTAGAPRAVGRLQLSGFQHQLLLRGKRLLVMGRGERGVVLTEVDVTTPSAPKVARTMELAGQLASARLHGGTARVVVASSPEPIIVPSVATLRRRAKATTTTDWLPRTTIRSRISRRTFRRSVVACDDVRRPREFSGLGLVTVLTIDLDKGLFSVDRDAVMAGVQDVYAGPSMLVVASRRFDVTAPVEVGFDATGGVTELHVFDVGEAPQTAYRASGTVPGFVLNQFAMSEHEGALRVATTEEHMAAPGSTTPNTESGVSVLRAADGRLRTVGRVTGLGKGERIYAVRFLGDRGYVVTFRQVDPLYTLDLRNATAPKVTGELKIRGYSAYLHPISDSLLLGVGQDATEEGRTLGMQVSLFDVGDPARPRLVARAALKDASSEAEQDHHAFLWWAPANLAVLPIDSFEQNAEGRGSSFSGAVGFRVTPDGVGEVGRISHPANGPEAMAPPIGRSVVVGDRLLTLSYAGIATNRVSDLAPQGFTPLP